MFCYPKFIENDTKNPYPPFHRRYKKIHFVFKGNLEMNGRKLTCKYMFDYSSSQHDSTASSFDLQRSKNLKLNQISNKRINFYLYTGIN